MYLKAILQAIQNQTAILQTNQTLQKSNSTGEQPDPWSGPSKAQATVATILYASLCTSLLAAFLAMLGKHWLHRYTRHEGGSVSERCEDRQRKLDGIDRWPFRVAIETPSFLLQLSLLLLLAGFSRYLWEVRRVISLVAIAFAGGIAVFYLMITCIGTFSYEFPFQTQLSFVFRHIGINRFIAKPISNLFPEHRKPDPGAGCVFWTLDHITDPEVTVAALGHLVNIGWHYTTPKRVPLPQVAKIYMKCFDRNNLVIPECREMARMAGRALIQLYTHQVCSCKISDPALDRKVVANAFNHNHHVSTTTLDHDPQVVTKALIHLSDTRRDSTLQPLSLIVKGIWEPNWGSGYRWEMMHFDLPWISELWVYHVWFRRTQIQINQVRSIVEEESFLGTVTVLFRQEHSPSPGVVRNILQGVLAGVSLETLSLVDLLDLQRWATFFLFGFSQH